jgi:glucose/arabinose dehydrogenase
MRLRTPLRRLCCALLVAALLPAAAPANAAVPAGFEDQDFLLNIAGPTAMAFLPDGRALVAQKSGLVRVVKDGALLPDAALDITAATCDDGERGLLGIAADPQFAANGYFYVYYTHIKDPPAADPCSRVPAGSRAFSDSAFNRVSRFKLAGDVVDASVPEQALIDRVPSFNTNHNAGDIHFGRDGYLYVSIGDGGADYRDGGGGGTNDAARHPARQPVRRRRQRPLRADGPHAYGGALPGNLRLGVAQPVPHRVRPEQRRHALLH